MKNISVIIPSLNPDESLETVVTELTEAGFEDIILVDDGSREENKKFFPQGENITLLIHPVNKGKGEALKTAMTYMLENRKDATGAVTCDSDGQHLTKDIVRTAEKMAETGCFVLGARDFSLEHVPFRSKFGNKFSAFVLSLFCGTKITDTQTGLRAFPYRLIEPMTHIPGSRFEYETNVLLELKSMKAKCTEVKIETVYHDENKGSHFRPVRDSLRIFSFILKYIFSSVASFVTDIGLFAILSHFMKLSVVSSTVIARIVSSLLNFTLNKKMVFKSGVSLVPSLLKYYALAIPVMLISAFGVTGIASLMKVNPDSFAVTLIKIIVDTVIFIVNYRIQKTWIFKNTK